MTSMTSSLKRDRIEQGLRQEVKPWRLLPNTSSPMPPVDRIRDQRFYEPGIAEENPLGENPEPGGKNARYASDEMDVDRRS